MKESQTILLVDDSLDDLFLLRRAFKRVQFDCLLEEAHNGVQAIAYLSGEGSYSDRGQYRLPSVIILDLNMPMKNGFDVLAWARDRPELRRIPIIVMTASMRPEDVERAFDLGANSFLVKPSSIESLATMLRSMREWMQINHFPPRNSLVTR